MRRRSFLQSVCAAVAGLFEASRSEATVPETALPPLHFDSVPVFAVDMEPESEAALRIFCCDGKVYLRFASAESADNEIIQGELPSEEEVELLKVAWAKHPGVEVMMLDGDEIVPAPWCRDQECSLAEVLRRLPKP